MKLHYPYVSFLDHICPDGKSKTTIKQLPNPEVPALKNLEHLDRTLPDEWTAVAILHPFSQPQCSANYTDGELSNPLFPFVFDFTTASLKGSNSAIEMYLRHCDNDSDELWLEQNESGTFYKNCSSCDLTPIDLNWTMPDSDWLKGKDPEYSGSAPLNWMDMDKIMDWWKVKDGPNSIWYWYERNETTKKSKPFRLMFSLQPNTCVHGSSEKLPLFQMFSFTYLVFDEDFDYKPLNKENQETKLQKYGFKCNNDENWPLFEWPSKITFSSMDIPIDAPSNPVPTKVTYHWSDLETSPFDRIQVTRLDYNQYNKNNKIFYEEAIMFGPNCLLDNPFPGNGYIVDDLQLDWTSNCTTIDLGQQPPNWPQQGQGKIHAVIKNPENMGANWISPFTGSNNSVALISVLFPPHKPNYPDNTYLWTWYDYSQYNKTEAKFTKARPITFMQSTPKLGAGTSLALADYFDYFEVNQTFPNEHINVTMKKKCGIDLFKPKDPNYTLTDTERAVEKVPRVHYKGSNFSSMSLALNNALKSSYPNNTKECRNWTVQELHQFQEEVFSHRY